MKSREIEPPLRVVAGLDALAQFEGVIEAATRLARASHAELAGLFVEDEALLRAAMLPFATMVGHTGSLRSLDLPTLERSLRAAQARARRALTGAAETARLSWSFQVTRGGLLSRLLGATRRRDLIVVGGASARSGSGAAEGRIAVLADRLALESGLLDVASRIASEQKSELWVLLPPDARGLANGVDQSLAEHVPGRVNPLSSLSARNVAEAIRPHPTGLLLISASSAWLVEPLFGELRARMSCPVVIVR